MGHRLLTIDDDPTFVQIIRKGLEKRGHEVESAGDPREGIRKAEEFQPDLILLDYVMPGLDGVDTLQMIKGNPVIWKIPVIMLTGRQDPHSVIHSMQSGALAYIRKRTGDFTATLDEIEKALADIPQD